MSSIRFRDADIDIEVRGPGETALIRLFRHPGAAYDLPAEQYRNGRFDPPASHKGAFATLYTADNIAAAAIECRILEANNRDVFGYTAKRASAYKVVRFAYRSPALFIRVDRTKLREIGVPNFTTGYDEYQNVALALFEQYGTTVHGLSWESFHRGQHGRNYGFWHHRAVDVDLKPIQLEADCPELVSDVDWVQLLRDHPAIESRPDDDPVAAPHALSPSTTPAPSSNGA